MIPRVGLGVLILNDYNEILLGKRINAHGQNTWGPPGGHLEFRESFEECGVRETREEIGIEIQDLEFVAITNDIFIKEDKHYVLVFMKTHWAGNTQIINHEPHKIEEWKWFSFASLPMPLFLPLQQLINNVAYGPGLLGPEYTK